ncbi:MAG: hypothetical protein ACXW2P_03005 [Thermoanaerobaculia bacterium]
MTGPTLAIGFVALIAIFLIYDRIQRPKRLKAAQEKDARLAQDAARRGWKLEVRREPRGVEYDYSGTADGIPWKFELRARRVGRGSTAQDRVTSRWSTGAVKTRGGILLIWPSFGMTQDVPLTNVPQFVLKLMLTPLINALGAEGPEAEMIANATAVVPDDSTLRAHYLLRATEPASMERFLDAGAREALVGAAPWLPVRDTPNHLIVASLAPGGLTVLVGNWIEDLDLIAKIADVGVQLAKAWQSGQRFS